MAAGSGVVCYCHTRRDSKAARYGDVNDIRVRDPAREIRAAPHLNGVVSVQFVIEYSDSGEIGHPD